MQVSPSGQSRGTWACPHALISNNLLEAQHAHARARAPVERGAPTSRIPWASAPARLPQMSLCLRIVPAAPREREGARARVRARLLHPLRPARAPQTSAFPPKIEKKGTEKAAFGRTGRAARAPLDVHAGLHTVSRALAPVEELRGHHRLVLEHVSPLDGSLRQQVVGARRREHLADERKRREARLRALREEGVCVCVCVEEGADRAARR